MLQKLLLRWAVLTLAVWLATYVVPDVEVHGGFWTFVWVALLFGLVNAIIGPFLRLLALPFTLLTLGLFALVVNGVLVAITAGLSEKFDVGGFFPAFLAALVISLVSMVLNRFTSGKKKRS
jgi:putative membrane protein